MRAVVDTSVIVAAALAGSSAHHEARSALVRAQAGAAGHAWVESFSVLTRLPADVRVSANDAGAVLASLVPQIVSLSSSQFRDFRRWLAGSGIVGGAVYDALVGWAARSARLPLLTRDRRAAATYERLDIEVLLIAPTT